MFNYFCYDAWKNQKNIKRYGDHLRTNCCVLLPPKLGPKHSPSHFRRQLDSISWRANYDNGKYYLIQTTV